MEMIPMFSWLQQDERMRNNGVEAIWASGACLESKEGSTEDLDFLKVY